MNTDQYPFLKYLRYAIIAFFLAMTIWGGWELWESTEYKREITPSFIVPFSIIFFTCGLVASALIVYKMLKIFGTFVFWVVTGEWDSKWCKINNDDDDIYYPGDH
jgi:TRAP-type C4-dicarboxylate transport system permease small subunit